MHREALGGPEGFNGGSWWGPEAVHCTAGTAVLIHPACSRTLPSPLQTGDRVGTVRLRYLLSLLDRPICPVGQGSGRSLLLNVSLTRSVLVSKPPVCLVSTESVQSQTVTHGSKFGHSMSLMLVILSFSAPHLI